MTMNPVSALHRRDRRPDPRRSNSRTAFARPSCARRGDIGAAIGCPIEQTVEARNAITRKLGAFRTSMLQDVEAGKPLEIDALLTVVREIGGRVGVPAPNLDALLGLTRVFARTAGSIPQRRRSRRARTGAPRRYFRIGQLISDVAALHRIIAAPWCSHSCAVAARVARAAAGRGDEHELRRARKIDDRRRRLGLEELRGRFARRRARTHVAARADGRDQAVNCLQLRDACWYDVVTHAGTSAPSSSRCGP